MNILVITKPSPSINAFIANTSIKIIIDTGATVNLINERLVLYLGLTIYPSSQSATQADGKSDLAVVGETRFHLSRGSEQLYFEGLVVRGLESEILAGIPVMCENEIGVFPSRNLILIGKTTIPFDFYAQSIHPVQRVSSIPAFIKSSTTLYPSESIVVDCPLNYDDTMIVIHPNTNADWLKPDLSHSVEGKVRLTNSSHLPISLIKDEIVASISKADDHVQFTDPCIPLSHQKRN